jgi:beta-N-acetylhexosaminidase
MTLPLLFALVAGLLAAGCGSSSSPASPARSVAAPSAVTPATPDTLSPASSGTGSPAPSGVCALPPIRFQVAQLLLVPVSGTEVDAASTDIVRAGVGGILLFGSNIESAGQVRTLIGALQGIAEIPLLVAVDEEPGRIARFAGAGVLPETPTARALGKKAVTDVRAVGAEIGSGLASLGVTVDLAPVLDVTGAAADSVIGDRSFGSSPSAVAKAGVAFIGGLEEAGIDAVAKHFPGHGETVVDSHTDLPVVTASLAQLRKRALAPFKAAINRKSVV